MVFRETEVKKMVNYFAKKEVIAFHFCENPKTIVSGEPSNPSRQKTLPSWNDKFHRIRKQLFTDKLWRSCKRTY